MISEEIKSKTKKEKRLRGFAATVAKIFEQVNNSDDFKDFAKTINIRFLLNPLDDKTAALITIEEGTLKVEGIGNKDLKNLKRSELGWNAKMQANLHFFLDVAAGKISQAKLVKLIIKRKVKVRGLTYFILLQKVLSFLPNSKEAKPAYMQKRTKPLIATQLFMITGFIFAFIWIFALISGIYDLSLSAYIFAYLYIWWSIMYIKLVKGNVMDESNLLRNINTILLFNSIGYFIFLLTGLMQGWFFLNICFTVVIGFNLINFIILFNTKSKLNKMDKDEKINFFSIILTLGLGWNLFFGTLSYLLQGQPVLSLYNLIFGVLILIYGNKLLSKSNNSKVHVIILIIISLTLISMIFFNFFLYFDVRILFNIGLFSIALLTRYYYIKKKF